MPLVPLRVVLGHAAFASRADSKPARATMKEACAARMTAFSQSGNGAKLAKALSVLA